MTLYLKIPEIFGLLQTYELVFFTRKDNKILWNWTYLWELEFVW